MAEKKHWYPSYRTEEESYLFQIEQVSHQYSRLCGAVQCYSANVENQIINVFIKQNSAFGRTMGGPYTQTTETYT